MITLINYGAGNLRSVENTLSELQASYRVVTSAADIARAERIVLPGVGHFGQMMGALDQMGIRAVLVDSIRASIPFLGICLGLQAMFETSEEAPEIRGLGLFPGHVARFPAGSRIPHMGWNDISARSGSRLLKGIGDHPSVYFAHSYYCPVTAASAATCEYGLEFTAALEENNVFGVQFHPEKSGAAGLRIVQNFVRI